MTSYPTKKHRGTRNKFAARLYFLIIIIIINPFPSCISRISDEGVKIVKINHPDDVTELYRKIGEENNLLWNLKSADAIFLSQCTSRTRTLQSSFICHLIKEK